MSESAVTFLTLIAFLLGALIGGSAGTFDARLPQNRRSYVARLRKRATAIEQRARVKADKLRSKAADIESAVEAEPADGIYV